MPFRDISVSSVSCNVLKRRTAIAFPYKVRFVMMGFTAQFFKFYQESLDVTEKIQKRRKKNKTKSKQNQKQNQTKTNNIFVLIPLFLSKNHQWTFLTLHKRNPKTI